MLYIERTTTLYGTGFEQIDFSTDGQLVAAGNEQNVNLYHVMTGEVVESYTHESTVQHVSLSAGSRYLASSGFNENIIIRDRLSGEIILTTQSSASSPMVWHPTENRIFIGAGVVLDIDDLDNPLLLSTWGFVYDAEWSPDGRFVATANGWDNDYGSIFDATTGERIFTFWTNSNLAWASDSNRIASQTQIRDITADETVLFIPELDGHIAWHPTQPWLTGTSEGVLSIWDSDSGDLLTEYQTDCDAIRGIDIHENKIALSCQLFEPYSIDLLILEILP
ncbi:MAG: hypothetical protein AAFN11_07450 [Chloroflexota bacterium]